MASSNSLTCCHDSATDRVQAEAALRASEARFRDLIEGSIQGILIHGGNDVFFVNQAYAEIFGYDSPDEIYALDSVLSLTAPHNRERLLQYQKARLAGESVPSYGEYQGVRKDGSLVWLEMRVRLVTWQETPVLQSTVVDITARKQAEEALRQSEERFRQLVEGSIQGIMIHRAGQPVFANQAYAKIYGYDSPEEILQVKNIFQDVIAPEDRARLEHYFQARLRGGPVPTHYACGGGRRDGSHIWVENIVTVVSWWGEKAIQCTVVDITERKRTEAALLQAERLASLGTLAAGLAHELNNPPFYPPLWGMCSGDPYPILRLKIVWREDTGVARLFRGWRACLQRRALRWFQSHVENENERPEAVVKCRDRLPVAWGNESRHGGGLRG